MVNKIDFRGVGVALVTPFMASGEVDMAALERLVNYVSDSGVDYLVVLGTTGESVTLNHAEKHRIIRHVVDHNQGKLPIVVGIGGNNTAEVTAALTSTDLSGVDAILSVTPYYNKPNQDGLYAHYAAVITASPLPIILYNVPGRTGVNMTAATTLRLANDFPGKAIAVKEASGNLSQAAYLLKGRPDGFFVISGDDNLTIPMIALGGDGTISVSANAFPEKFCRMTHAALDGDFALASKLNLELHQVTDYLFEEGNPAGVKAALEIKAIMGNYLRLPLVASSEALKEKIAAEITKYSL